MLDATPETIAIPLFTSATAAAAALPSAGPAAPIPELPAGSPETPAVPTMSLKAAVLNCRKAFNLAVALEKDRGATPFQAKCTAAEAYFQAMPFLTSEGNIRAFIACVGYAMTVDIMRKSEGLQLITAARAALAGIPRESRPVGRPRSNYQGPLLEK